MITAGKTNREVDTVSYELYEGDCLELMKNLPDKSVDMILCDPPYSTTRHQWDKALPWDKVWEQYNRIIKKRGCIAIFAQSPFDKHLAMSNIKQFKYQIVWEKNISTGVFNCNHAPLKAHELILIFSQSAASFVKNPEDAMEYYPQMTEGKPYTIVRKSVMTAYDTKNQKVWISKNEGTRHPRDVVKFATERGLHPTQKPVPLLEYLINTYTLGGGTVLDNCMGSGSTGVACANTGRNFIGMELNREYFEIAKERIGKAYDHSGESQTDCNGNGQAQEDGGGD